MGQNHILYLIWVIVGSLLCPSIQSPLLLHLGYILLIRVHVLGDGEEVVVQFPCLVQLFYHNTDMDAGLGH